MKLVHSKAFRWNVSDMVDVLAFGFFFSRIIYFDWVSLGVAG